MTCSLRRWIIPEADWPASRSGCRARVSSGCLARGDHDVCPSGGTQEARRRGRRIAPEIRGDHDGEKGRQTGRCGTAALRGKERRELIDFWKAAFGLISAIPVDTARVGALTPQLRELVRITDRQERKRLTPRG